MQTTWIKSFSVLSILLFCSCSNHGEIEVPEMASAIELTTQLPDNENQPAKDLLQQQDLDTQPAKALLQHQDLFGNGETESKGSEFAGDPLLGTESGLDKFDAENILHKKQADFSQEIDFDAE